MKDYILGGVANAHLFDGEQLFGNAITSLTESGINIAIQAEEVRGGKGAALLGRYFHSTGMTLTLTNATFNLEYLSLSCGATLETGAEVMTEESVTITQAGTATVTKTPVALAGCNNATVVWVRKAGDTEGWARCDISDTNDKTVIIPGATVGEVYCVKYFAANVNGQTITVKSDFVPKTLHLVLDADLFAAGDSACSAQTKVGQIVIDVPAFQLNGNQDLTMNMTGAATLNLEGMALAVTSGDADCKGGKYYAKIAQVVFDDDWTNRVNMIAVDEGNEIRVGSVLNIYAIFKGQTQTPMLITPALLGNGLAVMCGSTPISGDLKVPAGSSDTVEISLVKDNVTIAKTFIKIG